MCTQNIHGQHTVNNDSIIHRNNFNCFQVYDSVSALFIRYIFIYNGISYCYSKKNVWWSVQRCCFSIYTSAPKIYAKRKRPESSLSSSPMPYLSHYMCVPRTCQTLVTLARQFQAGHALQKLIFGSSILQ